MLIGNKTDLEEERVVDKTQAEQLASELGLDYIETSAKDGTNVHAVLLLV